MKFIKLFESFINEKNNFNLGIELANYLRTHSESDETTVDQFFDKFDIPASGRTDFAFTAILKQAKPYINMNNDDFNKAYDEYKGNINVNDYDTTDVDCEFCNNTQSVECDHCSAQGYEACPTCSGDGEIECVSCLGYGFDSNDDACIDCSGLGHTECIDCFGGKTIECTDCHGNKEVQCPHCN
jgi:hypothetical protein